MIAGGPSSITQILGTITRECVCSKHLLLDVVLPAADQRLELAKRDRVDPVASKCLAVHVVLSLLDWTEAR